MIYFFFLNIDFLKSYDIKALNRYFFKKLTKKKI